MNSYIIVAGDSWACGEWAKDGNNTHRGLRHYLEDDGYQTLCFGYPGMGSLSAYDFLSNFIRYNNDRIKIDKLIFFQSDWIRDIRSYRWLNDDHLNIFQKGYIFTRDWYLSSLYYRLSDLYKEFEIPSIVIGGQGDTIWIDQFETEHPGVKIGCQSFTNLIINDDSHVENPVHTVFKYGGTSSLFLTQDQFNSLIGKIKSYSNSSDLEELVNDLEYAEIRNKIFKKIYPDCMHPDRNHHKKLYNYLQDSKLL
jgi:hypothetical protein